MFSLPLFRERFILEAQASKEYFKISKFFVNFKMHALHQLFYYVVFSILFVVETSVSAPQRSLELIAVVFHLKFYFF